MKGLLKKLVESYQNDNNPVILEKIADGVKAITIKLTNTYEGFINESEIEIVVERSIKRAADTYDPNHGTQFTSYYYKVLKNGLINLNKAFHRKNRIASWKKYKEIEEQMGNLIDESYLVENTDIFDPGITGKIKLYANEKKYMALLLRLDELDLEITNKVAARALGVNVKTIYNIKKRLPQKLGNYFKQLKEDLSQIEFAGEYNLETITWLRKELAWDRKINNDVRNH